MNTSWKVLRTSSFIIIGVLSLTITVALMWFSSDPTYVLQISIDPEYSDGIELSKDQKIVSYKSTNAIYYEISGTVDNPITSSVLVSFKSSANPRFLRPDTLKISKSHFVGTLELVPPGGAINGNASYSYTIDSGDDNSRLSFGHIKLEVIETVAGTSPWSVVIISGIGLLASFIQIFQLFPMGQNPKWATAK